MNAISWMMAGDALSGTSEAGSYLLPENEKRLVTLNVANP